MLTSKEMDCEEKQIISDPSCPFNSKTTQKQLKISNTNISHKIIKVTRLVHISQRTNGYAFRGRERDWTGHLQKVKKELKGYLPINKEHSIA